MNFFEKDELGEKIRKVLWRVIIIIYNYFYYLFEDSFPDILIGVVTDSY